jgi:GTP-binding protein
VLIVVVDVSGFSGRQPADDLDVLRRELTLFDADLAAKPQLVAANKIDAATDESLVTSLELRARELDLPFFRISAVAGTGLQPLLEAAWAIVGEARAAQTATVDLTSDHSA